MLSEPHNHDQTGAEIKRLLLAWGATEVTVTNNSHLHVGHEGAKSGGGHFAVRVVATEFTGMKRIKCHRLVYQQLAALFADGRIHALEVDAAPSAN